MSGRSCWTSDVQQLSSYLTNDVVQFGRFDDLEAMAEADDEARYPVETVRPGDDPDSTRGRFEDRHAFRDEWPDIVRRRFGDDFYSPAIGRRSKGASDLFAGVEHVRNIEGLAIGCQLDDPVQPKDPQVISQVTPTGDVPGAAMLDQAIGINLPLGLGSTGSSIAD